MSWNLTNPGNGIETWRKNSPSQNPEFLLKLNESWKRDWNARTRKHKNQNISLKRSESWKRYIKIKNGKKAFYMKPTVEQVFQLFRVGREFTNMYSRISHKDLNDLPKMLMSLRLEIKYPLNGLSWLTLRLKCSNYKRDLGFGNSVAIACEKCGYCVLNLVRLDEMTKNIYVLATKDSELGIEAEIFPNGRVKITWASQILTLCPRLI